MQFGDLDVGEAFFDQAVAESLLDVVFAVNDKDPFDLPGFLAGEKLGKVFVIAVSAHAADAADFGVYFMDDSENMHLFGIGDEAATEGVGFAIAHEEDGIA